MQFSQVMSHGDEIHFDSYFLFSSHMKTPEALVVFDVSESTFDIGSPGSSKGNTFLRV